MSTAIFPFAVWQSGTNENSIPANDNALRNEVLAKAAISVADSEPGAPAEGDIHVIGTAWGTFSTDDVVIYEGGTWLGFEPFAGWSKMIGTDLYFYDGSGWELATSGGGGTAPVVTEAGASLAAIPADAGNYTRFTDAGAKTYAFNDTETYVVGAEYHGRNAGAGDLTITESGTMVINPPAGGTLVIPEGGTFTVKIVGASEADLIGVTVSV